MTTRSPSAVSVLVAATVAAAVALGGGDAAAFVVARVTSHGYVLVDDGAGRAYNGRADTRDKGLLRTAADVTAAIAAMPGAPAADYVAILQHGIDSDVRAAYLPVRSDVLGIGGQGPGAPEVYDHNAALGMRFPIDGVVFLNALVYFTHPSERAFSQTRVCPEEFAHRFGARVDVVARGLGARDGLLGRQGSHWSYFLHTGGSPLEGNAWEEVAPGVFRTARPSLRFSPLELYLMGLAPASEVPPTFLIAGPDVMGQRDARGELITAESPTERPDRAVVVRGRRVPVTLADVVAANGPRKPERATQRDPRVAWVLLSTPEAATEDQAAEFDAAVEACAAGYRDATGGRATLRSVVAVTPGTPRFAWRRDAGAGRGEAQAVEPTAPDPGQHPPGGFVCAAPPRGSRPGAAPGEAGGALAAVVATAIARRRRRAR